MWLPKDQHVRTNRWRKFERTFSKGDTEIRYIREIIYGHRRAVRYWQLTSDPITLPDNSTWYLMSHAPVLKFHEIGNQYGFRIWVEYGLKQSKDERSLGRLSHNQLQADPEMVGDGHECIPDGQFVCRAVQRLLSFIRSVSCPASLVGQPEGGKNLLNNIRLVIQPLICFNWLKGWLEVFAIPQLAVGFALLIEQMSQFVCPIVHQLNISRLIFSSA